MRLYPGAVIRQAREERQWSQEGLCSGICAVSYLSKIEQGKAEASPEILRLLFARLELAVFAECRKTLPIGYASFHLPWVLEWYTATRQYRLAYELSRDFPIKI